jgi:AcrR family transcriptional regulator
MTQFELKQSNNLRRRDKKNNARQRKNSLSAADWVETAADLLLERNISSVDIPDLCKRLGVTKGSFYWHFNARGDLLTAILNDWRRRMTLDVNVRARKLGASAETTLRYLLGLIRKPRPNRIGAIERSVRDWARIDPVARSAVIEVDQTRLAFFEGLIQQCGFSQKEAHLRAYAAYALMMGDSILKQTIKPTYREDDYINTFVELLLSNRVRKSPSVTKRLTSKNARYKGS